jgi:hypothetical protein
MRTLPGCSRTACFIDATSQPSLMQEGGAPARAERALRGSLRYPRARAKAVTRPERTAIVSLIRTVRRRLQPVFLLLPLVLGAAAAGTQPDEHAYFTGFNWFDIIKLDPAAALTVMWDHAASFPAPYDTKAILSLLLKEYGAGRDLEKAYPYDPSLDALGAQYKVTTSRAYSARLALPWDKLLKLNVRSAMQYILLEVLSTNGVPKAQGKIPAWWTLFDEYFGYYVVLKGTG